MQSGDGQDAVAKELILQGNRATNRNISTCTRLKGRPKTWTYKQTKKEKETEDRIQT